MVDRDPRVFGPLRKKLADMFTRAYPDATSAEAQDWRVRKIGKQNTSEWSEKDYLDAIEILRVKLGIPARPRSPKHDSALSLGL